LTTTVKPWRLPIDQLRWGRFLSNTDSVVWIEWLGPRPHTWVFTEGGECPGATVTTAHVSRPDEGSDLRFTNESPLRSDRVAAAVPQPLRLAVAAVPGFGSARETKWLAGGSLIRLDRPTTGWVVHEVVQWR
jgi:hypothetical protein